jgi:hypothetical protein
MQTSIHSTEASTDNVVLFPARGTFGQTDLFCGPAGTPTSTGTIVGLAVVMLHRPCRDCGSVSFVIGSSAGPHHAALRCVDCGHHGGWLSRGAIAFINMTVEKFGMPTEPVAVRENKKDF